MSIPATYPYAFDPTYGLRIEQLKAIEPPEPPREFDAFWQQRYARTLKQVPNPTLKHSATTHPDWTVYDISYTSTGGFKIGGWLLLPRSGMVRRGMVVGHGYGGREGPDFDIPVEHTALLFPCFRGLSRSALPPISTDPAWHVLHDIDKPECYIIGGCVEDVWVSITVLTSLFPSLAGQIGYSGISFGGGIGALAIAYDSRIDRGHLIVPTFGNRPLWLSLPTIGSGHAVQKYLRYNRNAAETLRLYDAASAATRIQVPMLVAVALFDPAVAPPCQFSVANALPKSNYNEIFILDAGHFDYPESAAQHALLGERVEQFFRAQ